MHEIFASIKHLAGFTPPLSKDGKRLATYGDAVIREAVLRRLLKRNEPDLTRRLDRVTSRENQAKLVRLIGLPNLCSLPISFYDGGHLEDHSLSTILESVVGECSMNDCGEFVAEVARLLDEIYSLDSVKSAVRPSDEVENDVIGEEAKMKSCADSANPITFVYEWAAGSDDRKPVIIWTREGENHCCEVTAGEFVSESCSRNKRKAKASAFSRLRDKIVAGNNVAGNVPEQPVTLDTPLSDFVHAGLETESEEHSESVVDASTEPDVDLPYSLTFKEKIAHLQDFPCVHDNLMAENTESHEARRDIRLMKGPDVDSVLLQELLG